jgi:hypothetical protein
VFTLYRLTLYISSKRCRTYGEVFKGNWFGDVAVKKLKIAHPTEEDMALFKNEILGLRKTRHGARLRTEIYTRGCLWIPHMFA